MGAKENFARHTKCRAAPSAMRGKKAQIDAPPIPRARKLSKKTD
jgi:hypothetical protein